jgi:hypothetical protein
MSLRKKINTGFSKRVVVFFLSVADSVLINWTIPTRNNCHTSISLIYFPFDMVPEGNGKPSQSGCVVLRRDWAVIQLPSLN